MGAGRGVSETVGGGGVRGAIDTLVAASPNGTLIARPANFHRTSTSDYSGIIVATCLCGWCGPDRKRRSTAERDAARHEAASPAQTIFQRFVSDPPEQEVAGV
jgi:hypothetical protein